MAIHNGCTLQIRSRLHAVITHYRLAIAYLAIPGGMESESRLSAPGIKSEPPVCTHVNMRRNPGAVNAVNDLTNQPDRLTKIEGNDMEKHKAS